MRIYLSGPISGHDLEERRNAFREAKEKLEGEGNEVFNPMENGLPADATTREHLHRDLAEMTREDKPYDMIYLMRRWAHSAGCRLEFEVATSIGMIVAFEESEDLIAFE